MSLNSKKKMVRLVSEEGRTIASVNKEYNLGEGTVRSWIRQFEEECEKNPETKDTKDIYEENRRLLKKLEEAEKEVRFLKKQPHSSQRKSIRAIPIY